MKVEKNILLAVVLIVGAVFSRLIPHPMNFTPLIALALFSTAVFKNRSLAIAIPLVALVISDLVIGMHSLSLLIYFSFALIGFMSIGLNRENKISVKTTLISGTFGAFVFFMISNLGVWATSGMYAKTFEGLTQCYVAALPFFHNTLSSTFLYSFVLFGAWSLAKKYAPSFFVKSEYLL